MASKINRARLIKQLKIDEGFIPHVYACPSGFDTVGIGRNLEARGLSGLEIEYLGMENFDDIYEKELTPAEGEFLLNNDIDLVLDQVSNEFEWFDSLNAVRKEIIINMVFNLGLA
jgi:lysozyme